MFVVNCGVNVALGAQKVKRLSDLSLRHVLKVSANVSDVNALARFALFDELRNLFICKILKLKEPFIQKKKYSDILPDR